jgi:AcrR family transcriptional regulator
MHRSRSVESKAPPRERVLAAASRLFHENGIRATGVDTLIRAAGVAKATFYRHFRSKDALVVAWLNDPRSRWLDRVRMQADRAGPAPDRIVLAFFDAAAEWLESEAYRGCPYLNAAAEITDPAHPAQGVIRSYLEEVGDYLLDLVTRAGYRHPSMLAAELQNLMAGGIMLTMARRSGAPAQAARVAAEQLLGAAQRA